MIKALSFTAVLLEISTVVSVLYHHHLQNREVSSRAYQDGEPIVLSSRYNYHNELNIVEVIVVCTDRDNDLNSPRAANNDEAFTLRQHDGSLADGPNVDHFFRGANAQQNEDAERDDPREAQTDRRSLKEAVGERFKLGIGVNHRALKQPEDAA